MQATRTAARPATLRENNGQLPVRVCVRVHVVLCWLAALFGPENKQLDPLLVFSCSAPPQADPKKQAAASTSAKPTTSGSTRSE